MIELLLIAVVGVCVGLDLGALAGVASAATLWILMPVAPAGAIERLRAELVAELRALREELKK